MYKNWNKVRTQTADNLLAFVRVNLKNGEFVADDQTVADAIKIRVDTLKRIITQAHEMKTLSVSKRNGLRVYRLYEPEQPKPISTKLF